MSTEPKSFNVHGQAIESLEIQVLNATTAAAQAGFERGVRAERKRCLAEFVRLLDEMEQEELGPKAWRGIGPDWFQGVSDARVTIIEQGALPVGPRLTVADVHAHLEAEVDRIRRGSPVGSEEMAAVDALVDVLAWLAEPETARYGIHVEPLSARTQDPHNSAEGAPETAAGDLGDAVASTSELGPSPKSEETQ